MKGDTGLPRANSPFKQVTFEIPALQKGRKRPEYPWTSPGEGDWMWRPIDAGEQQRWKKPGGLGLRKKKKENEK